MPSRRDELMASGDPQPDFQNVIVTLNSTGANTSINGFTGNAYTLHPIPLAGISGIGFSPTITTPECLGGHTLSEDLIEYIDGVVVAYCAVCNDRCTIARLPGGISFLRVKALLGSAMGLDDETAHIEHFNVSDMLGEFATLRDELEKEEFAIQQARKLIEIAGKILEKKLFDGEPDSLIRSS